MTRSPDAQPTPRTPDAAWAEQMINRWRPDERSRSIEAHARELAGSNHAHGAIPARFWRQAIEREAADAAALDPELLAWALHAERVDRWGDCGQPGDLVEDHQTFHQTRAERIAAEYNRLRSEGTPDR